MRFLHVNVRVDRLDEAVGFYRDVMGLEPVERLESRGRGAWFKLGGGELHLTEESEPQPLSNRHFAVEVESLSAARHVILTAGRPIERAEENRFFTRDPAGNRIEIVSSQP